MKTDVSRERVSFAEAISHPSLLKKPWGMLSVPQQVVLKAFYGLPLQTEQEILHWSAFQGFGIYDELGYLQGITREAPYTAKEYDILTAIFGRRSGKSDRIGGLAAAYEITLGGHTEHIRRAAVDEHGKKVKDAEDQDVFWLYIAQDLATATTNMKFVLAALDESPVLRKQIGPRNMDSVQFKNGIILRPAPATIRVGRGVPVIGITMDEFGFWYKDSKAANPDYEVVTALEYSLSQFPHAKQLRLSTPWTKEGLLYAASQHGTEGLKLKCEHCTDPFTCTHMQEERADHEGHLVVGAPTAVMGNPHITRRFLKRKAREKEKFTRESLAQFTDTQTSFLAHAAIERAVEKRLTERQKVDGIDYVAAMDPAFRGDGYTFTVTHHEKERGIVQDYVEEWIPEVGEKLNPGVQLDLVKALLDKWGLNFVYSDQHHLESLQVLAEDRDFTIVGRDLTVKSKPIVMKNLESQLNQGRIKLLDNPRQTDQLKKLKKTKGPTGYERIAAPNGEHDDLATVLALAVTEALKMPATETTVTTGSNKHPFIPEAALARMKEQWDRRTAEDPEFAAHTRSMQTIWSLYGDE